MADTIAEQILAGVASTIAEQAALLVPPANFDRNPEGDVNTRPALRMFDGDETIDDAEWGRDSCIRDFNIEGHVTGGEAAANELAGRVRSWLLADPTVANRALELRITGQDFTYSEGRGQKVVTGFRLAGLVSFWTKPGDPFTAAP